MASKQFDFALFKHKVTTAIKVIGDRNNKERAKRLFEKLESAWEEGDRSGVKESALELEAKVKSEDAKKVLREIKFIQFPPKTKAGGKGDRSSSRASDIKSTGRARNGGSAKGHELSLSGKGLEKKSSTQEQGPDNTRDTRDQTILSAVYELRNELEQKRYEDETWVSTQPGKRSVLQDNVESALKSIRRIVRGLYLEIQRQEAKPSRRGYEDQPRVDQEESLDQHKKELQRAKDKMEKLEKQQTEAQRYLERANEELLQYKNVVESFVAEFAQDKTRKEKREISLDQHKEKLQRIKDDVKNCEGQQKKMKAEIGWFQQQLCFLHEDVKRKTVRTESELPSTGTDLDASGKLEEEREIYRQLRACLRGMLEEEQKTKQQLQAERETLKEELENTRLRLSRLAGAKLTEGNPAIADLSDPNRATRLGEMYSELYDNQWTDAFEFLRGKEKLEELAAIESLRDILQEDPNKLITFVYF